MAKQLHYGTTAKVFHWLIVALLMVQYPLGKFMPDIHRGMKPGDAMTFHISFGITILALIVLRFFWRITHPVAPASSLPVWQQLISEAAHWLLYATAHQWYSWHLIMMGRNSEAIAELREAESLDPLSLIISADVADALSVAHQFDEAEQQSRKTLQLDPNFAVGHYELGQALEQKHLHDQAIAEFQKAIEISGHSGAFDSNLGYAYAVSGRGEEAIKIVKDLESRRDQNPSIDADIALIYFGLGDQDQAMSWLNKGYEARFKASILLRPAFDPLRSDARFKELLRRIGLPDQG